MSTQDVARSGDVQAIGDFHARFPAARLAMHDKAALRLHRAAPEHDRFVGEALVLEFHLFHHLAELEIGRSEEHTSELQSLMRISYAVFCLKKKKNTKLYTR